MSAENEAAINSRVKISHLKASAASSANGAHNGKAVVHHADCPNNTKVVNAAINDALARGAGEEMPLMETGLLPTTALRAPPPPPSGSSRVTSSKIEMSMERRVTDAGMTRTKKRFRCVGCFA